MQKIISDENRENLDRDGYCVVDELFSKVEMEDLAVLIEAHQRRHRQELIDMGGSDGGISRADEITFTDHLAESDDEIMKFVKRQEFVSITTELLGGNTDLYWNQSVYKSPGGSKQFPWHQDDGYMAVEPSPYLTIWLAVNDVTVENGSIWVLPGSHIQGLLPHVETPIGKSCYSLDAEDQGIPVPLGCGSAAVFWSLTMHKSGVNVSDGVRKGYVIQYSVADLKYAHNGELVTGLVPIARDGSAVSS